MFSMNFSFLIAIFLFTLSFAFSPKSYCSKLASTHSLPVTKSLDDCIKGLYRIENKSTKKEDQINSPKTKTGLDGTPWPWICAGNNCPKQLSPSKGLSIPMGGANFKWSASCDDCPVPKENKDTQWHCLGENCIKKMTSNEGLYIPKKDVLRRGGWWVTACDGVPKHCLKGVGKDKKTSQENLFIPPKEGFSRGSWWVTACDGVPKHCSKGVGSDKEFLIDENGEIQNTMKWAWTCEGCPKGYGDNDEKPLWITTCEGDSCPKEGDPVHIPRDFFKSRVESVTSNYFKLNKKTNIKDISALVKCSLFATKSGLKQEADSLNSIVKGRQMGGLLKGYNVKPNKLKINSPVDTHDTNSLKAE